MSPFMFFFSASTFLSGFVCLLIGTVIIFRSRNPINLLYFALTVGLFWVGICETFMRVAASPSAASYWLYFSRVGWLAVFPTFLYFSHKLSNYQLKRPYLIYLPPAAVYFITLFVFPGQFVSGFRQEYFGYRYLPGPWEPWYALFFISYVGLGLFQLYQLYKRGKAFYNRKQAELILWAALVPLVIGSILDEILPILGIAALPITIQTVAIMIGVAGYAILRYSPLAKFSEGMIAESVADALFDGLFLTDKKGIVNYVNPAGCKLSHCRADELLGKEIGKLFEDHQKGLTRLVRKGKNAIDIELSAFPLLGEKGSIYMARDLSNVTRSRNAIAKMSQEEKSLIEREQKIIAFLARFSELEDQKRAEEWWKEVERQGEEVITVLRPVFELGMQYLRAVDEVGAARDELAKKVEESDQLNRFMSGRDEVLQQLEEQYKKLSHSGS